jgi:uncharacterized tellurite resistance protein B-like protein
MSFLRKLSAALTAQPSKPAIDRHLAMAVLLLETARADFERSPQELTLIREQLAHAFGLEAAEADALIRRAADSAGAAVSLHDHRYQRAWGLPPARRSAVRATCRLREDPAGGRWRGIIQDRLRTAVQAPRPRIRQEVNT